MPSFGIVFPTARALQSAIFLPTGMSITNSNLSKRSGLSRRRSTQPETEGAACVAANWKLDCDTAEFDLQEFECVIAGFEGTCAGQLFASCWNSILCYGRARKAKQPAKDNLLFHLSSFAMIQQTPVDSVAEVSTTMFCPHLVCSSRSLHRYCLCSPTNARGHRAEVREL